jgi:hypothetical protein
MHPAFAMPKTNAKYLFIIFSLCDIFFALLRIFIVVHIITSALAGILFLAADAALCFTAWTV